MANATETITIGDRVYTVLFPDLVRPLTDAERQDLKSSIERYGIKQEVVVDEEGNSIIDGANRTRIAAELGLPVIPTRIVETKDEEDKRQLALALNLDRRHLSPDERKQKAQARRQRVQEARAAGKSIRTIAEEQGVSHEQIRKDLAADAGVNWLTPDGEKQSPVESEREAAAVDVPPTDDPLQSPAEIASPDPVTIKGRDGKSYPGRRRTSQSAAEADEPSDSEHDLLLGGYKALLACDQHLWKLLSRKRPCIPKNRKPLLSRLTAARDAIDKIITTIKGATVATTSKT